MFAVQNRSRKRTDGFVSMDGGPASLEKKRVRNADPMGWPGTMSESPNPRGISWLICRELFFLPGGPPWRGRSVRALFVLDIIMPVTRRGADRGGGLFVTRDHRRGGRAVWSPRGGVWHRQDGDVDAVVGHAHRLAAWDLDFQVDGQPVPSRDVVCRERGGQVGREWGEVDVEVGPERGQVGVHVLLLEQGFRIGPLSPLLEGGGGVVTDCRGGEEAECERFETEVEPGRGVFWRVRRWLHSDCGQRYGGPRVHVSRCFEAQVERSLGKGSWPKLGLCAV